MRRSRYGLIDQVLEKRGELAAAQNQAASPGKAG